MLTIKLLSSLSVLTMNGGLTWWFGNGTHLFTDLLTAADLLLGIYIVLFCLNIYNYFLLILILELIYLFLNIKFLVYFLFNSFFSGPSFALVIMGFSASETLVGLALITKFNLYNSSLFVSTAQLK